MARLISVILAFISLNSIASNYPPDYCDQVVRVAHDGPVVFAHVGSGCMDESVVGYQNSGTLAAGNPDSIDMVVVTHCNLLDGSTASKTMIIKLDREWHGTGYMSAPFRYWDLISNVCSYFPNGEADYQFAFSDGQGHWDSKSGANYRLRDLHLGDSKAEFFTHDSGSNIAFSAWDFIVSEMRK